MIQISNTEMSNITLLLSNIRKAMESGSDVFKANFVRRGSLLLSYLGKKATPAMQSFLEEVQNMQAYLEEEDLGEIGDMVARLQSLSILMARSGRMLAQARAIRAQAERDILDGLETDDIRKMPSSTLKKMLQVETAEIGEIEDALDRINRACVHQSDNLRTIISFTKEELKLTRSGY